MKPQVRGGIRADRGTELVELFRPEFVQVTRDGLMGTFLVLSAFFRAVLSYCALSQRVQAVGAGDA